MASTLLSGPAMPRARLRFHFLSLALLLAGLAGCTTATQKPATITTPANHAPTADAGSAQQVRVGARVILDGEKSADPDGSTIHYHWSLTAPAHSTAALDDLTLARPSFTADLAGEYDLSLVVDDGMISSAVSTVKVTATAGDLAPIADAGANRSVTVGSSVQLDGTMSHDPDGDALTYRWTLSAPAGSAAALDHAAVARPGFTADVAGIYRLTLVVNDGQLDSAPASVAITAQNGDLAPVADAGTSRSVAVGTRVTLDGEKSSDGDGDMLTYRWTLVAAGGSSATLDDATAVKPAFTADVAGAYRLTLIVNDGQLDSAAAAVIITAENKPVADAGTNVTTWVGATMQLSGAASTRPGAGVLSYAWTLTPPPGSSAALSSTTSVTPSFTPDVSGQYGVELVVSDGVLASDPAYVTVTAKTHTIPIAQIAASLVSCGGAGCVAQTTSARVGDTLTLDGRGSIDSDSAQLSYRWSATDPNGDAVDVSDSGDDVVSFDLTIAGSYTVTLIVNDGFNDSAPVESTITVTVNNAPAASIDSAPAGDVAVGSSVDLSGSGSDPDGDPVQLTWEIAAPGSALDGSVFQGPSLSFVPDVAGDYQVWLTANDGRADSPPVSVTITVD